MGQKFFLNLGALRERRPCSCDLMRRKRAPQGQNEVKEKEGGQKPCFSQPKFSATSAYW
jgi:hypothetical protein